MMGVFVLRVVGGWWGIASALIEKNNGSADFQEREEFDFIGGT